jgi:hypothetical protein
LALAALALGALVTSVVSLLGDVTDIHEPNLPKNHGLVDASVFLDANGDLIVPRLAE